MFTPNKKESIHRHLTIMLWLSQAATTSFQGETSTRNSTGSCAKIPLIQELILWWVIYSEWLTHRLSNTIRHRRLGQKMGTGTRNVIESFNEKMYAVESHWDIVCELVSKELLSLFSFSSIRSTVLKVSAFELHAQVHSKCDGVLNIHWESPQAVRLLTRKTHWADNIHWK